MGGGAQEERRLHLPQISLIGPKMEIIRGGHETIRSLRLGARDKAMGV